MARTKKQQKIEINQKDVKEAKSQRLYKLIDVIDYPTRINVATRKKGYLQYAAMTLHPGKVYVVPEGDDILAQSLFEAVFRKEYSEQMEMLLKANDIPYTVELCRVCGGRKKKIVYHPVEEVTEEQL